MSWWQSLGLPGTQIDPTKIQFPIEIELLPDLLKASISLCSFNMSDEEYICWTYASDGLKNSGQKELLLSIRKQPEERISDFPQAPLEFFKTVMQHSLSKEYIESGSISDFGEGGFLSDRFCAAAYVRSQPLGDWFPPPDSLATVLLTRQELAATQLAGLVRVLSLMGKTYLHYPCPVWNDLNRDSVVSSGMLETMSASFIAQMPRMLVRNSGVSALDKVIDLELPLSARHYFKQVSEMDEETPLLLMTDLDERAEAILVYQSGKKETPMAISAPGAKAGRVSGSFICFAPAQSTDHGMIIEDGFALSLRPQSWQALRQSLLNGSPYYLARQEDAYDFRLSWHQDEEPEAGPGTIQISGINPGCRGQNPDDACADAVTVAAYATNIKLLTHESEIRKVLDSDLLRRYISHIEDVVREHFFEIGTSEGFDLSIDCSILPENKSEFEVTSSPIMEAEDESDLRSRLELTYSPSIEHGKIKFRIELAVWGGRESAENSAQFHAGGSISDGLSGGGLENDGK